MAVMVHMVEVPVMVVVVVACICLLDGSPHAKLRQPVHGGQATLQFRGHVSHRLKGEEEMARRSAVGRSEDHLAHWTGAGQQPWLKSGRAGGLFTMSTHL